MKLYKLVPNLFLLVIFISCGASSESSSGPGPAVQKEAIKMEDLQAEILTSFDCNDDDAKKVELYDFKDIYREGETKLQFYSSLVLIERGKAEIEVSIDLINENMLIETKGRKFEGTWYLTEQDSMIVEFPDNEFLKRSLLLEIKSVSDGQFIGPRALLIDTSLLNMLQLDEYPEIATLVKDSRIVDYSVLSEQKTCD